MSRSTRRFMMAGLAFVDWKIMSSADNHQDGKSNCSSGMDAMLLS